MSATLNVRIRRAEGCLLRLLGQIGRRGYEVLSVKAELAADGKAFDVAVGVEPFVPMAPGKPRPLEVLPALVAKLADVLSVELVGPPPAGVPKAPAGTPGGGRA
jgi:acetolactate synthase regulatory subunit